MPHKLLITLDMKPPSKYRKLLSKNETISGKPTEITVSVKNIGNETLPDGGQLEVFLKRPIGTGEFNIFVSPTRMPAIKPDKAFGIRGTEDLMAPGLWFITITAKFKDKKKIEYHQTKGPHYEKQWLQPIYVIDRHQLDLTLLLKKLLRKEV